MLDRSCSHRQRLIVAALIAVAAACVCACGGRVDFEAECRAVRIGDTMASVRGSLKRTGAMYYPPDSNRGIDFHTWSKTPLFVPRVFRVWADASDRVARTTFERDVPI